MSRIPIKSVKQLANDTKQDLVIVFAIDGDGQTQNIATWGRSVEDCSRAADWANKMKDKLGWPESLQAQPSRVRKLQARIKELDAQLAAVAAAIESAAPEKIELAEYEHEPDDPVGYSADYGYNQAIDDYRQRLLGIVKG